MEKRRRKGEEQKSYARWSMKEIAKLIELNGIVKENYVPSNEKLVDVSDALGRSVSACIGAYHQYIKNDRYKILSRDVKNKVDSNNNNSIESAIALLKANGYKVMKPVTEYMEI
jgi:hypothetical protein